MATDKPQAIRVRLTIPPASTCFDYLATLSDEERRYVSLALLEAGFLAIHTFGRAASFGRSDALQRPLAAQAVDAGKGKPTEATAESEPASGGQTQSKRYDRASVGKALASLDLSGFDA